MYPGYCGTTLVRTTKEHVHVSICMFQLQSLILKYFKIKRFCHFEVLQNQSFSQFFEVIYFKMKPFLSYVVLKMLILKYFKIQIFLNFEVLQNQTFS